MVMVFSPETRFPDALHPVLLYETGALVRLNSWSRVIISAVFPREIIFLSVYECVGMILFASEKARSVSYHVSPVPICSFIPKARNQKVRASSVVTESLGLNFPSLKPLARPSL